MQRKLLNWQPAVSWMRYYLAHNVNTHALRNAAECWRSWSLIKACDGPSVISFFFIFIYLFGCPGSWVAPYRIFVAARGIFSCGMWDLVPHPGTEPRPPELGARSLTHWTTREVPPSVINCISYSTGVPGKLRERTVSIDWRSKISCPLFTEAVNYHWTSHFELKWKINRNEEIL